MEKLEPLVHIYVFPRSEIDVPAGAGGGGSFTISDVFRGFLLPAGGESNESNASASDNYKALEWQGQPAFDVVENLEYFRCKKDGTAAVGVQGLLEGEGVAGGWTLKVKPVAMNCVMSPAKANDPVPSNNLQSVTWKAKKGTSWETYVPDNPPYLSCIRHREQKPNSTVEAEATLPFEAAGWEIVIDWNGIAAGHNSAPGFRLVLEQKGLSIVWRGEGAKPSVELWANRSTIVNGTERITSGWALCKTLNECKPISFTNNRTTVRLRIVGGRRAISIDEHTWFFFKTDPPPRTSQAEVVAPLYYEAVWNSNKISVSSFGVDARISMRTLTQEKTGKLARTVTATVRHKLSGGAPETCTRTCVGGWKPAGTKIKVTGTRRQNLAEYQVELTANRKQSLSPFVSSAILHWPGAMTKEAAAPIDIRPACLSMRVSSGEPDLMPSAEAQITVDRTMLNKLLPDWQDYLLPFAPVRILAAWKYADGTDIVMGEWTRLLDGYLMADDKNLQSYQQQEMTLIVRDALTRIKEPAGFIDERYAPLDLVFFEKGGAPLFGGECVQHLLGIELGEEIANKLNGTGDPLAMFSEHYPLMSVDEDRCGYFNIQQITSVSTQDTFMLPPPFDRDLYSWITESIAKPDRAVILWGDLPDTPVDGDDDYAHGTRPFVPIYGRVRNIMAAVSGAPVELPDAIYVPGDENDLVGSASSSTITDKAWNDFVVRGPKPEGVAGMLTPSFFSGRARLPVTDPNSPDMTWSRVHNERLDFVGVITDESFAQALAILQMLEFQGNIPRHATVVMPRGTGGITWGTRIKPKFVANGSDNTIGLNDVVVRAQRINHNFDLSGRDALRLWNSEFICRSVMPY